MEKLVCPAGTYNDLHSDCFTSRLQGVVSPRYYLVAQMHEHSRKRDCLNCVGVASFLTLGIQSPCQMMIGVYNHLRKRKVFRFH